MATEDPIAIEIGHLFAWIRSTDVMPLIAPVLTYTHTTFDPSTSNVFVKKRRTYRCFEREQNGELRILAGHAALVKRVLEHAGRSVLVQDQRQFSPKATPCMQVIEESHGSVRGFLEIVAREPRGLIEVHDQTDVLGLTARICTLFPAARIYIPVATRRQVGWTRRALQRILRAPVNVYEDYAWPWEGGRLVCTLRMFDRHHDSDLEVVICPEASHAVVPAHFRAFGGLPFQRVYGFRRAGVALSDRSRLQLQGLFGPVVYRSPDPQGPQASVLVHWCTPPENHLPRDCTALERKRRLSWRNDRRNDLVAAVARALRDGDRERLWQPGLFLGEEDEVLLSAPTRSVAILVESTEHGHALCRRLPGWALWDAPPVPLAPGDLPPGVQSIWKLGTLDRVIVTLVQASWLESVYTDLLIVASGEGWPNALPGFPPRLVRPGHRAHLLDLADDVDPASRRATRERLREYERRGWSVSGAPRWLRGEAKSSRDPGG